MTLSGHMEKTGQMVWAVISHEHVRVRNGYSGRQIPSDHPNWDMVEDRKGKQRGYMLF